MLIDKLILYWYNNKCLHLGTYNSFDEAVLIRKQAENKYYGEYSYDNSMKIYKGRLEN